MRVVITEDNVLLVSRPAARRLGGTRAACAVSGYSDAGFAGFETR
ncbi:hypothetical protein [Streptomyces sp. NPDC048496]